MTETGEVSDYLRYRRERRDARRAEKAAHSDWLDKPWGERRIFGVDEIGNEFARKLGSVDIDGVTRASVIVELADWARRGQGEFFIWTPVPPHLRPFEPEDRANFPTSDRVSVLRNGKELFAARATAESFFLHYGRIFPPAWSVTKPAARALTIKAENDCRLWLLNLMQAGKPTRAKGDYLNEAAAKFGIGKRGFKRAWDAARAESDNEEWGKPGPKSKQ